MSSFNPHDHLLKQGWKGKGTALKDGHITRPLATVQKKSMGGIGKDRDEAVPFWDHIFAATAASIASSSTSPATSGANTPTTSSTPTLSIAARSGREIAKRQLYSSFFRGSADSSPKPSEPEPAAEAAPKAAPVSRTKPLRSQLWGAAPAKAKAESSTSTSKDAPESKEDRRVRKEAKRQARAEKAARKLAASAARDAEKADKVARRAARAQRKKLKEDGRDARRAERAARRAAKA
ncbi:uncharacterized protein LOC62_05G006892 [Vanrija pseudolonga]|uniref:G-patch domain-containing protein n=1 Tax=Vanrija pseudolonga TaxID=143232 RepID=A0AAF1BSE5_9TREE|nr:hypothetical protein LOC62_05G006892 [Vanrija pseudolonga]